MELEMTLIIAAVMIAIYAIFQQQVPQYFISVEQGGGSRTIKDINGLLSFLESTINNSLNTFIKQSISISKLNKIEEPLACLLTSSELK